MFSDEDKIEEISNKIRKEEESRTTSTIPDPENQDRHEMAVPIGDFVRSATVSMKSGRPAECAKRAASALLKTAALLLALYLFICRLV